MQRDKKLAIHQKIYSVRAECGVGEFLWSKSANDECLLGGLEFSLMETSYYQDTMSMGLFNEFRDWAKNYMDGQPADWSEPWQIDFEEFDARGTQLAQKFYRELGGKYTVQYVTSDMDPRASLVLATFGAAPTEANSKG